eukprot:885150-Alexandrium_andersonii.AAC.1
MCIRDRWNSWRGQQRCSVRGRSSWRGGASWGRSAPAQQAGQQPVAASAQATVAESNSAGP